MQREKRWIKLEEMSYKACYEAFLRAKKKTLEANLLSTFDNITNLCSSRRRDPGRAYFAALLAAIIEKEVCSCDEPMWETSSLGWKCSKCKLRKD